MQRLLPLIVLAGCADSSSTVTATWSGCEPSQLAPGDLPVEVVLSEAIEDESGYHGDRELARSRVRCSDGGFTMSVEPADDYRVTATAYRDDQRWLVASAHVGYYGLLQDPPADDWDFGRIEFDSPGYRITGTPTCSTGAAGIVEARFLDDSYATPVSTGARCGEPFELEVRRGRYDIVVLTPDYQTELALHPDLSVFDRDIDLGAL